MDPIETEQQEEPLPAHGTIQEVMLGTICLALPTLTVFLLKEILPTPLFLLACPIAGVTTAVAAVIVFLIFGHSRLGSFGGTTLDTLFGMPIMWQAIAWIVLVVWIIKEIVLEVIATL